MRHFATAGWLLIVLAPWAPAQKPIELARPQPARRGSAPASFARDVKPLLEKHCFACHGSGKHKGDIALDTWANESAAVRDLAVWQRVVEAVRSGEMPPAEKPPLPPAARQRLEKWIEAAVFQCDCDHPDPGRAPIRRLNRAEYNNTIRDLLGVDFRPADDFPVDDSGHGFDNMADALSLSPVLLEKYLAAADQIVNTAFVLGTPQSVRHHFPVDALEIGYNARQRGDGWVLLNSVEEDDVAVEFRAPAAGTFLVRARARAIQTGSNAMQLTWMLGPQPIQSMAVATNSAQTYEARLSLAAGRNRVRAVVRRNKDGLPEEEAILWKKGPQQHGTIAIEWVEIEEPVAVERLVLESHQRLFHTESQIGTDREVARDILGRFARRAYRRPVSREEVSRLVQLAWECWRRGDSFEMGIARAVQAVLVSPHFLFRHSTAADISTPPSETAVDVDEFTLASRLSYFLWSSLPDERLLGLAEKNQLRANLEPEVRRLLGHAKARAVIDNFAGQWLQTRNLETIAPDKQLFPQFDEELRQAMRTETELLFANVMQADRSILELLTADYTYVNERLARHYGIKGVKGPDFDRVSLAGTARRGVLTHAGVLALTSNPTRTSPVKRGKWVLETLLNAPPPPPPPNVPELKEGAELTGTLRQRLEQHRDNPLCASCHERMDPIGFAMEHFDAIGAWRAQDGKEPVDAAGALATGEKFNGAASLVEVLATQKRQQFIRAFAEKLLTYALGRGLEYADKCAVDEIVASAARDDHRFSAVVLSIVRSVPFQKQRAESPLEFRRPAATVGANPGARE